MRPNPQPIADVNIISTITDLDKLERAFGIQQKEDDEEYKLLEDMQTYLLLDGKKNYRTPFPSSLIKSYLDNSLYKFSKGERLLLASAGTDFLEHIIQLCYKMQKNGETNKKKLTLDEVLTALKFMGSDIDRSVVW